MRINPTILSSVLILAVISTTAPALAQLSDEPDFDACGTLVRGVECVLFEGGGGRYVLSDYAGFKVGDAVRVIGTLDEACITICQEGDGCIRGAEVFSPAVFPCGTPVSVEFDPCGGLSSALVPLLGGGLLLVGVRRNPGSKRRQKR